MEIIWLDTDVLIDFLRGDAKTVEKIKKLEDQFELATTAINLFKLYYGAYKTGRERNLPKVWLTDKIFTEEELEDIKKLMNEYEKEMQEKNMFEGKPIIKGTRITVEYVLELLAQIDEVTKIFLKTIINYLYY